MLQRKQSQSSNVVETPYGIIVRNSTKPTQQGNCNSCWAIATAQVMSDRLRNDGKITLNDELNYYMFHDFVVGKSNGDQGCEQGAYLEEGMNKSMEYGIPLMSMTRDRSFNEKTINTDLVVPRYKAKTWKKVSPSQIKQELLNGTTIVTIINLYPSFDSFRGSIPYKAGALEKADDSMYHMVSIVGFDDRDNTWILRNSYGTSWGNQGYFKVYRNDPQIIAEHYAYAPII